MQEQPLGIHDLCFATTENVLAHSTLAAHTGVDVAKYHAGIGQELMSVAALDEDIVTIAAAAAQPIIDRHGTEGIRTVLLGTETGIDQSKSAGIYVASLLGLSSATRVLELKQACYGATGALQLALAMVARNPDQRVLVLASDIAKYDLDSPGEPTQGAAAVALLVGADPALVRIDGPSGLYTADIMDFWRPNYRSTAVVDGKASIDAYLQAVEAAWKDYSAQNGLAASEFASFCYHQPFTKMAYKAHAHLAAIAGLPTDKESIRAAIEPTTLYNRVIGNSYTASVFIALASLLDHTDDLDGRSVGMLSYGSGCVAEFFGATVMPGYRDHRRADHHRDVIARRQPIDYQSYRALHATELPTDGGTHRFPRTTTAPYRLAGIDEHKRIYEVNHSATR
ncbi:hydroxymethylglutaryl-CoA synthase [Nocardia transvalensis]|uniref:hydroxymethylglutaryl-CoA synthase n=1 Tax=Nocardia transvalensis TaxID=37333 RepID=UPI001892D934|nr:hydroxymethylglutaryl-CoA synthase [Nocardia transvalensis]MBF6329419.1 hydroxymethylglutaryl-CoA synthase [Nocardia transvalensis]